MSCIKGIGCDMVDVARIERLLQQSRFLQKVYTPYEQAVISAKSAHTAAGLWAAKEAVSKALGTGFRGFSLRDIEICQKESGQPFVKLNGSAASILAAIGAQTIHLSITHERDRAMAFAIAE